MASSSSVDVLQRRTMNSRHEWNRRLVFLGVDMNLTASNRTQIHDHRANDSLDEIEHVWKDLEIVVNNEKWDKIVRERFVQTPTAGDRLSLFPKSYDVTRSKISHFLKVAIETAVNHGKLFDVKSLLRLTRKYKTPLDDGSSEGVAFMAGLMAAAITDERIDIIRELIENGGNLNQVYKGTSPLSRAVSSGSCHVICTLIQYGADPNQTTPTGKTTLHEAASMSSADVINCLLDNGACPEVRDKIQGNTPLHIACSYCNREAVLAMYDRGAEFNAANDFGDTPLAKLLRPLTKTDDFHNNSRMELAKEIITLGFILGSKKNKPQTTDVQPSSLVSSETRTKSQRLSAKSSPSNYHLPSSKLLSSPQTPSSLSSSSSSLSSPQSFLSSSSPRSTRSSFLSSLQPASNTNIGDHHCRESSQLRQSRAMMNNLFTRDIVSCNKNNHSHLKPSAASASSSSSLSSSSSSSSSSDDDMDKQCYVPSWPQKEDRLREIYQRLSASESKELNLQQRCRIVILHSLGTRPLTSNLCTLGLPSLVIKFLRQGGREG